MKIALTLTCLLLAGTALCAKGATSNKEVKAFLKNVEGRYATLYRDSSIAGFQASISGKDEDYKASEALQLKLKKIWADPDIYKKAKLWHEKKALKDPLQKRQVELIYLNCQNNQMPEKLMVELVQRQTVLEKTFNTYRAKVDGKEVTDNDLNKMLQESTDSAKLEAAWKASKEIGDKVSGQIIELVKLRNQAAKAMGYANFHAMQLSLGEQEPQAVETLFDELDQLTRKDYLQVKSEVDAFLAKRLNIKPEEMRPWHYQDRFFQEAPAIYSVDLDGYYAKADIPKLAGEYYKSLGMPVDDILAKSDLYEKPGKYQHAFCSDMDHAGDVRILCNIKPNAKWMETMLHELGHGVYAKFNDPKLPWILRDSAHAFTTEAIANLFGRYASNPVWMMDRLGISKEACKKLEKPLADTLRLEQLVFSRWSQLMFRFEKALYENPDQDLNKLWWDLAEKYQSIKRPEGRNAADWAAKIHIALYPAYYQNYLLGQLLASQLEHYIHQSVLKSSGPASLSNQPKAGRYLIDQVFKPGCRYRWDEMIKKATGEALTAKHYAAQFIR